MDNPLVESLAISQPTISRPVSSAMSERMPEPRNDGSVNDLSEPLTVARPMLVGVPRLPIRVVNRSRITDLLDERWPSGVTVVRGGAGAGKTMGLVSWLHSSGALTGIVVWHTIDSVTARRASFWQRLNALLREGGAYDDTVEARILTPREVASIGFRQTLVSAVVALGSPLTLVLDEFDHIADETIVNDLAHLVAAVPTFRIVVASRMPSGFEAPRRAIGLDTRTVRENQLAFTPSETMGVLKKAGVSVRPSEVNALTGRLQGWPAGIRIAALAIEASELAGGLEPFAEVAEAAAIAYVRNIFLTLDTLKPGLFTFLKKTSIVEGVVPDLARTLTGADDSAELLQFVEHMGIASHIVHGGVPHYRYGNITRTALSAELLQQHGGDVVVLHRRAALWYEGEGHVMRAFSHAVKACDSELVSALIQRHWPALVSLHAEEFRELVQNFPEQVLWRDPTLVTMLAVAYHAPPVASGRLIDLFSQSADVREQLSSSATVGEKLALNAVRVVANRFTGDFDAAVLAADELFGQVSGLTPTDEADFAPILATVSHQAGLTHLAVGNLARAADCFKVAWARSADAPAEHTSFHIAASSALCWSLGGDMGLARTSIDLARGCDPTGTLVHTHVGIDLIIAEALVAAHAFDLDTAARILAEAAEDAEQTESFPVHVWAWATVLGLQGDPHGALDVLDLYDARATAAPTASPFAQSMLASVRAITYLRLGLAVRARNALAESPIETQWTALARATAQLLGGDHENALRTAIAWVWRTGTYRFPRAALLVLKATALLRHGKREDAAMQFGRALSLMERSGAHLALATVSQRDRDALAVLVNRNAMVPSGVYGMPESVRVKKLSAAELRVLEQLAETPRIDQIAAQLYVTRNTVKGQLRSVYRKLDASGRSEALETAYRLGLLAPRDYLEEPHLPTQIARDIGLSS